MEIKGGEKMRIQLFIGDKYWYSFYVPERRYEFQIAWCKPPSLQWWKSIDESTIIFNRFIFEYDRMVNEKTARYILVDVK